MINNFPFFRLPFYRYPYTFPRDIYSKTNTTMKNHNQTQHFNSAKHTEINNKKESSQVDEKILHEKKSSKYSSIGPILINTNGFSNKEEPVIIFSGLKLYLDDLIILSILYFLYKEDVKDDMLFILLILLLIS